MKKFVSCLLCLLFLVVLYGLTRYVMSGNYLRLVLGLPFRAEHLFSEKQSAMLLPSLVLGVFGLLDITTILARSSAQRGFTPQPNENPLGYALVRLRRYMLVPLGLSYVGLLSYLSDYELLLEGRIINDDNMQKIVDALSKNATILLGVLFAISRRPLAWTHAYLFGYLMELLSEFMKGFAQAGDRHHH